MPERQGGRKRRLSGPAIRAEALAAPILILGAPRSGTTWLAKIIDSHPDVLYRHEPDAVLPGPSPLTPSDLPPLLARWAADTRARTAAKRPFFRKSWQPEWAYVLHTLLAIAVGAAGRMPSPISALARLPIPDLGACPAPRLAIKSIAWTRGAAVLSRALPASRTIFILRHPCGQVASVMRGNSQRRFDLKTGGTDMPFDEAATIAFAAAHGADATGFQALPDAAKYAWAWRAFNEPAYAALAAQPNVHVVLYEALCAEPRTLVRRILAFAGLSWDQQTETFLARSTTHRGEAGYYGVFRDAVAAAEAWRSSMSSSDQQAVRSVAAASPLARFWPDLVSAA
ncbi:MAG TPA: sulfotransferase [Rhodopila sp.]